MSKFPISHWIENITFDDKGNPSAVYFLPMDNYSNPTSGQIAAVFQRMNFFFYSIAKSFKILSVCREVSPDSYERSLTKLKTNPGYDIEYRKHIDDAKSAISRMQPWKRELYIIVPLETSKLSDSFKRESFKDMAKDLKKFVESNFLSRDTIIQKNSYEKILSDEEDVAIFMAQVLGASRASNEDIRWILNTISTRSIQSVPTDDIDWGPNSIINGSTADSMAIIPIKNTIMSTHYNYIIETKKLDYMTIKHSHTDEVSYQSFIQFADYPDEVYVPGNEVFFRLEESQYPIDICIEAEYWDPDVTSRKLHGKNLEMIEQAKQYSESITGAPIDLQQAYNKSKLLEHKLNDKMPIFNTVTTIAISAKNEKDLKQIRRTITDDHKNYYAVVAPGKQREAYMQFMPIMTNGMKPYAIPLEPGYIASTMINANIEVGEKRGYYLGYVDSGNQVPLLFNPTEAQKNNKTATTAVLGNLGGGKSVLNKTIIYYMLMWGSRVIAIDPKDENKCFLRFPSIKENMKQIDVGVAGSSINPYKIAPTKEDTISIVVDFLSIILNANEVSERSEDRRIAIQKAVTIVSQQEKQNMDVTLEAFKWLYTSDESTLPERIKKEAETCHILLDDYRHMAISNTVFSDEDTLDMSQLNSQFVNFNISKLPLPTSQDIENMGTHGRLAPLKILGSAIMYLIVQFARYATLTADKRIYKVLSIDEGWKITSSPQGADLMMEIIRMGRTYNIMPIIATQSASDLLNEKIRNNIGIVFMFKNKDEQEIINCSKLLGMEECSKQFIAEARALESGQCFYRDLNDRVCRLRIEPKPRDLLTMFDTRPEAAAQLEEVLKSYGF